MGNLLVRTQIGVIVGVPPTDPSLPFSQKDYAVDPIECQEITDFNQNVSSRIVIQPFPSDDVDLFNGVPGVPASGSILFFKSDQDVIVQIGSVSGTSQGLNFKANRLSMIHCDFTAVVVTNPNPVVANVRYCIVGV